MQVLALGLIHRCTLQVKCFFGLGHAFGVNRNRFKYIIYLNCSMGTVTYPVYLLQGVWEVVMSAGVFAVCEDVVID